MTVASEVSSVSHAGDGVTLAFAIPFRFLSSSDISVVRRDDDLSVTELTTGFSITGAGGAGGTCTFTVAPAADVDIIISRAPEVLQPADYTSNDAFPAEATETALDRQTFISQYLHRLIQHCITVPFGDSLAGSGVVLPSADTRASKYLAFGASGEMELAELTSSGAITSSIIAAALDSLVRTAEEIAAGVTPTNYAYPPGDIRRYGGATAASAATNATAIQASLSSNGFAYIPPGTWSINPIVLTATGQRIFGAGQRVTILSYTGIGTAIDFAGFYYCQCSGFRLNSPSAAIGIDCGSVAHFFKVVDVTLNGSSTSADASGTANTTGVGIQVDRSYYGEIRGNDICAFGKGVYGTNECNGNFIVSNSIRRCRRGIHIDSITNNSDGCMILGNEIEAGEAGDLYAVELENCSNMMVAHNRCEYHPNGTAQIYVHGTGGGVKAVNNSLWDNRCLQTGVLSIKIGDNSGVNKVDNTSIRGGYYANAINIGVDANYTELDIPSGRYIGAGVGGVSANLTNSSTTSILSILEDQATTLTLTGCTTSPTGAVLWTINKNVVTFHLPSTSGTSNTTAATLGTLPALARPQAVRNFPWRITDNSATVHGLISIGTDGVITLSNVLGGGGAMTSGGTKGVLSGSITYPIA